MQGLTERLAGLDELRSAGKITMTEWGQLRSELLRQELNVQSGGEVGAQSTAPSTSAAQRVGKSSRWAWWVLGVLVTLLAAGGATAAFLLLTHDGGTKSLTEEQMASDDETCTTFRIAGAQFEGAESSRDERIRFAQALLAGDDAQLQAMDDWLIEFVTATRELSILAGSAELKALLTALATESFNVATLVRARDATDPLDLAEAQLNFRTAGQDLLSYCDSAPD